MASENIPAAAATEPVVVPEEADDVKFGFKCSEMFETTLAGTVPAYDRHVFLCYKSRDIWPPRLEGSDDDPLPNWLAGAFRARKNDMKVKAMLTICETLAELDLADGDVLIFPDMIKYRGLKESNVDSFMEDVIVGGKAWGAREQEVLTGSYVFVCADNKRDSPVLIGKFKEEVESKDSNGKVVVYFRGKMDDADAVPDGGNGSSFTCCQGVNGVCCCQTGDLQEKEEQKAPADITSLNKEGHQETDWRTDWSLLPKDILLMVESLVYSIEDQAELKAVCKNWGFAFDPVNPAFRRLPGLLLPEKPVSSEREIYSLPNHRIRRTRRFPAEAKGKRCIDVGFGWIMALGTTNDSVILFNLSSDLRFELPSYERFPAYKESYMGPGGLPTFFFIHKGMLTANPSETQDFKLMVIVKHRVGIWKNGDNNWTELSAQQPQDAQQLQAPKQAQDMLLRADGKIYLLGQFNVMEIWAADLSRCEAVFPVPRPSVPWPGWVHYLVDSTDGELLVVARRYDSVTDHFGVMRVDLVNRVCTDVHGLGNDAIFLGHNVSLAVAVTECQGLVKPNCIYFTDARFESRMYNQLGNYTIGKGGGKEDIGIYNVEDGSISRIESFFSCGGVSSSQWVWKIPQN